MAKCTECGAPMQTRRDTYKHKALGLPNVTLLNVEIRTCKECGEEEVVIPKAEQLRAVVAEKVLEKPGRLAGAEIRFLRKFVGWSGVDFAAHFGVAAETVSRWENDHEPIGPVAERLLRFIVARGTQITKYDDLKPEDVLDTIKTDNAEPIRMRMQLGAGSWQPEIVAAS